VAEIHTNLQTSLREVEVQNQKEADRQKKYYDRHAHAVTLVSGDQVLVQVGSIQGKHKVHDKWESGQYEVEGPIAEGIPVYIVRHPLTGDKKTLHRNRLFLVNPIGGTEVTAREARSVPVPEDERGANPGEPGENEPAEKNMVSAGKKDEDRSGHAPPRSALGLLDRIKELELEVISDIKHMNLMFLSMVGDDDPTNDKG
jgi:hypothetical protein